MQYGISAEESIGCSQFGTHHFNGHSLVAGTSSAAALFSAFLAASFSFSSLISLNFLMFSVKSGPLCKVMKSFAFLLSPLDPATVIVLVLISLNVAYLFLKLTIKKLINPYQTEIIRNQLLKRGAM